MMRYLQLLKPHLFRRLPLNSIKGLIMVLVVDGRVRVASKEFAA